MHCAYASWDLDAIANAFAEAAVDPARWNAAMEAAADATGSYGAALFPVQGRLPNVPQSRSMAPSFETYIKDGWIQRDERYRSLPAITRRGTATEFDFITSDEIARHPYYQEFLAPHGLRWFGGVRVACADDQWILSIQRSIEQGPFAQQEIGSLAGLSQKLGSAAALARALGFARAEGALAAFEVSGTAVVLLDRFAQVMRANPAAERMLSTEPRIQNRRVVSTDHDATVALDRALHAILWNRNASALMGPVPLPRPGKHPVLAYPVRLAAVSADALATCQAVVVLVDPDERNRPPETALQTAFGLTPAEARLASRLATGEAVEAASDSLRIAKETARNQLKGIFDKTGVHRQPELVVLLVSLLGQVVGGS